MHWTACEKNVFVLNRDLREEASWLPKSLIKYMSSHTALPVACIVGVFWEQARLHTVHPLPFVQSGFR